MIISITDIAHHIILHHVTTHLIRHQENVAQQLVTRDPTVSHGNTLHHIKLYVGHASSLYCIPKVTVHERLQSSTAVAYSTNGSTV